MSYDFELWYFSVGYENDRYLHGLFLTFTMKKSTFFVVKFVYIYILLYKFVYMYNNKKLFMYFFKKKIQTSNLKLFPERTIF